MDIIDPNTMLKTAQCDPINLSDQQQHNQIWRVYSLILRASERWLDSGQSEFQPNGDGSFGASSTPPDDPVVTAKAS